MCFLTIGMSDVLHVAGLRNNCFSGHELGQLLVVLGFGGISVHLMAGAPSLCLLPNPVWDAPPAAVGPCSQWLTQQLPSCS